MRPSAFVQPGATRTATVPVCAGTRGAAGPGVHLDPRNRRQVRKSCGCGDGGVSCLQEGAREEARVLSTQCAHSRINREREGSKRGDALTCSPPCLLPTSSLVGWSLCYPLRSTWCLVFWLANSIYFCRDLSVGGCSCTICSQSVSCILTTYRAQA